jgi:hypothetical protein
MGHEMTDEVSAENEEETRLLAGFLSTRDVKCPLCGYNLRGLTSERCPECGEVLRLQVGGATRYTRCYIALLIACGLGLGASGLILAAALIHAPAVWWNDSVVWLLVVLFLGSGGALLLVLTMRPRFCRVAATGQQFLCCLMWAFVLGMSIVIAVIAV